MAECPTCEKLLATEAGMRQHHTKVHGKPLPNRQCTDCGSSFYDEKARREFCDDCNPNAGEQNGNWKGGKESETCRRCDDEFEYYPSEKKGVYCPKCVTATDEFLGTPYAEVHDIERTERECEHCGADMSVLVSERKRGNGRFCSQDCLAAWMSENRRGENHHQWRSEDGDYTGKWWTARRSALQRDDYRCQHCGKSRDEIGRNPDVHHIVPLRSFDDSDDAHRLENLISLCRSCHRNAEAGNIAISGPKRDSR